MITALFVWCLARNLIPAEALWGSVFADVFIIAIVFEALAIIFKKGKND